MFLARKYSIYSLLKNVDLISTRLPFECKTKEPQNQSNQTRNKSQRRSCASKYSQLSFVCCFGYKSSAKLIVPLCFCLTSQPPHHHLHEQWTLYWPSTYTYERGPIPTNYLLLCPPQRESQKKEFAVVSWLLNRERTRKHFFPTRVVFDNKFWRWSRLFSTSLINFTKTLFAIVSVLLSSSRASSFARFPIIHRSPLKI